MKDVLNNMITHPIKTTLVMGAIGAAITDVINAIRGKQRTVPFFNFVVGTNIKDVRKDQ